MSRRLLLLPIVLYLADLLVFDVRSELSKEITSSAQAYSNVENCNLEIEDSRNSEDVFACDSIVFLLWTRKNLKEPEQQKGGTIKFKNYGLQRKNIILIHGLNDFNASVTQVWDTLPSAFLIRSNFNVIGVDWSLLAKTSEYDESLNNTVAVGCCTAALIDCLRRKGSTKKFHVVAVEMGTMVAATAAGRFLEGKKIERITGLDPCSTGTRRLEPWQKLSKESADVVEVVHTSGTYTGIVEAIGHRDFYPNGGNWPQPSCYKDESGFCSISLAIDYYAFSVAFSGLKATLCSSYRNFMLRKCEDNPTIQLYNNVGKEEVPEGKYYLNTFQFSD